MSDKNYLKIEYKRVFGQFEDLNQKDLIALVRKDNSAKNKHSKKGKHTYHVLVIDGLNNLIGDALKEIKEFVKE